MTVLHWALHIDSNENKTFHREICGWFQFFSSTKMETGDYFYFEIFVE